MNTRKKKVNYSILIKSQLQIYTIQTKNIKYFRLIRLLDLLNLQLVHEEDARKK